MADPISTALQGVVRHRAEHDRVESRYDYDDLMDALDALGQLNAELAPEVTMGGQLLLAQIERAGIDPQALVDFSDERLRNEDDSMKPAVGHALKEGVVLGVLMAEKRSGGERDAA